MNVDPSEQVFEEILPYLGTLDAQIGAIVQLLEDKGMTTNEEFANTCSGLIWLVMLGSADSG